MPRFQVQSAPDQVRMAVVKPNVTRALTGSSAKEGLRIPVASVESFATLPGASVPYFKTSCGPAVTGMALKVTVVGPAMVTAPAACNTAGVVGSTTRMLLPCKVRVPLVEPSPPSVTPSLTVMLEPRVPARLSLPATMVILPVKPGLAPPSVNVPEPFFVSEPEPVMPL